MCDHCAGNWRSFWKQTACSKLLQGSHSNGGLAIVAMRQLPQGSFLRMRAFFLKNAWHFKDFFREFEDFLKVWILFENIFRVIEAFFSSCEGLSNFLNTFLVELKLF
jgi:hypothetical protein